MILKHNISFVGGGSKLKGEKLTPDEVKELKASGTKYHEAKPAKVKKVKATKDAE